LFVSFPVPPLQGTQTLTILEANRPFYGSWFTSTSFQPLPYMSAYRLSRATKPLSRSLTVALTNCCPSANRHGFSTTALRGANARSISDDQLRRQTGFKESSSSSSPKWSLAGVCAVAIASGLLGWGVSELQHGSLLGAVLLDGSYPKHRYASMRELELVRMLHV